MKAKLFSCFILVMVTQLLTAQESKLWTEFREKNAAGEAADLPDFSFAGYQRGEKPIPEVRHRLFDVTDFGARPDDNVSDRQAVILAVAAAQKNGSGIVFFPPGRYCFNGNNDPAVPITIKAKNIVFRGSGSGENGTELFMENMLPPKDPDKMWSSPYLFEFTGGGADKLITRVSSYVHRGSTEVPVSDPSQIKPGDWIALRVKNNDPGFVRMQFEGHAPDEKWTTISKEGVYVNQYHQVARVIDNKLILKEPVFKEMDPEYNWEVYRYSNFEEVGVEELAFVGNWHEKFSHHLDWRHDGGYSLLKFQRLSNSWIRNCRFTDVNCAVNIVLCANVSCINCTLTGTPGHTAVHSNASSRVFIGGINDISSHWHASGVTGAAIGTVIWRSYHQGNTSIELHASQPRYTLVDVVKGGLLYNRGGGAVENMPNHLEGLVLWNYEDTGETIKNFEFRPTGKNYWWVLSPVLSGFHGAGTTIRSDQVKVLESPGMTVNPESLFEAQLELRLGELPSWIRTLMVKK